MKWWLVFALLSSCASYEDIPAPKNGEELLSEFGLAEEEKAKFAFKEVEPTPTPTPLATISSPDKPQLKPVPTPKPTVVETIAKATPKPMPSRAWPEDYPEEFKTLEEPARKTWSVFKPIIRVGEKLKFEISYLGITAGTITFTVLENGKRGSDLVHHFKATLSSADYYKYIYSLDDYVESFVLADTFMPLKYTLIQRESGQSVDDLQLFDHENYQSKQWFKRIKDGKTKRDDKVAFVPPIFLDPLSLLSFFRGLPLENGDEYFIPVVVRSKLWKVSAKVEKRETVEAADVDRAAIKVVVIAEPTEEGKKPTTMNLWYAQAPSRELLRFNAELKFGSVEGELLP